MWVSKKEWDAMKKRVEILEEEVRVPCYTGATSTYYGTINGPFVVRLQTHVRLRDAFQDLLSQLGLEATYRAAPSVREGVLITKVKKNG